MFLNPLLLQIHVGNRVGPGDRDLPAEGVKNSV